MGLLCDRLTEAYEPEDREELLLRYAQFRDTPNEFVPWPFRNGQWEDPTKCPKCGRWLRQFVWADDRYRYGYLEAACAGKLNFLFVVLPSSWLFFMRHWTITLARAKRNKYVAGREP